MKTNKSQTHSYKLVLSNDGEWVWNQETKASDYVSLGKSWAIMVQPINKKTGKPWQASRVKMTFPHQDGAKALQALNRLLSA